MSSFVLYSVTSCYPPAISVVSLFPEPVITAGRDEGLRVSVEEEKPGPPSLYFPLSLPPTVSLSLCKDVIINNERMSTKIRRKSLKKNPIYSVIMFN